MKRSELAIAIKAATEIMRQDKVLVVGSQSILGTFDEDELPAIATFSVEVDIAPLRDDSDETAATLLDGQAGEWSTFHETYGFYIQGVGSRTAILPKGWNTRLVPVVPPGAPQSTGLCLDPVDLCVAKLVANREKDLIFVDALIGAGLIDPARLRSHIDLLEDGEPQHNGPIINAALRARLTSWTDYCAKRHGLS
jgi:hypothetical protein